MLWQSLWRYRFSATGVPHDCVLDLGADYGSFINAVAARRRIAVDAWEGFPPHLAPETERHLGSVTDRGFLDDGAVDFGSTEGLPATTCAKRTRARMTASYPGCLILRPGMRFPLM